MRTLAQRPEPAASSDPGTAWKAALGDLRRGAACASVIGVFINVLHLATPLYTIQIYDRVIASGSFDTLVALSGLALTVIGFQALLDYLRDRIYAVLGAQVAARLGRAAFEAAVETTLRDGAATASTTMRDLSDMRNFIASGAIALPADLLMTPLFLATLFLLHPVYGYVGLAAAAVLGVLALATEFLARRPTADAARAANAFNADTAAAIRNAEVIAAMGMLPAIARRWDRTQAETLRGAERRRSTGKALAAAARALRQGLQIGVLATGAALVIRHEASGGTIIAASVLMARLLSPFEHLIDGWRRWMNAFAVADRLRSVLERGATSRSREPIRIAHGALTADRLTYAPQGQEVPLLRGVSFEIGAGELLGIIGPSGAGKSTLARLIVGLWRPTAGAVFLDGQSTYKHERASFGEAVGYLPQEPLLLDGTVRENVARFRDCDMDEVITAARRAGVHEMIGTLPRGYETRLADAGARLSGGQRQRLALARALIGDPRLIVLDEPNSSLDAEGEAALVHAIEAARERGATIVVVAQRMSILKRADRLLVLRDGAVAQFGPRAEVMEALSPRGAERPARIALAGGSR